jgi:uncharacterized repeat protein (TIGR03803 family)
MKSRGRTLSSSLGNVFPFAVCIAVLAANAAFSLLTSANTALAPKPPYSPTARVAVKSSGDDFARLTSMLTSGLTSGGLTQIPDGSLFGTTDASTSGSFGELFEITPTGQVAPVHIFGGEDGSHPNGQLLYAPDGYIYGVTSQGGANGEGTAYRVNPRSASFELLHSFGGNEGSAPTGGLILGPYGSLYGTTSSGASGHGTVFALSLDGHLMVLHSFTGKDGSDPAASLLLGQDGMLYGTSRKGGTNNRGTVFKLAANGASFQVLHSFSGADGSHPDSALVQTADGTLFGTAADGGPDQDGSLFELSPNGSHFSVVHSFTGYSLSDRKSSDGSQPASILTGSDGFLYGVTLRGGQSDAGTVYKLDPSTGEMQILLSYRKPVENPASGLVMISGALYMPVASGNRMVLKSINTAEAVQQGIVFPQATDPVTTNADSGAGSLRAVIAAAAPGDTITFDSSLTGQTITLTSGEIIINEDLTITGPGSGSLTISGNSASRVFFMLSGTVNISGLTITNGIAQGGTGGGGNNGGGGGGAGMGGGLFVNAGSLTLTDVNFNQCSATGGYGGTLLLNKALGGAGGGGIAPGPAGNGGPANAANLTDGGAGGSGGELGGVGGAAGVIGGNLNGGNGGDGAGGGGPAFNISTFAHGNGGAGGFGGGGGGGTTNNTGSGTNGGAGGFGGGGGGAGFVGDAPGAGGMFGGNGDTAHGFGNENDSGGGGAGLGGALFIRAGNLLINSGIYSNNTATGGNNKLLVPLPDNPGLGKGGAIFINTGVTETITSILYSGNNASDALNLPTDNNDIYGASCIATTPSITAPASVCASSTGNTASGPAGEGHYSWTITGGTITAGATSQTVTFAAGASGTVVLTLNIIDTSGCGASNTANISIASLLVVGPSSLPSGTAGVAYPATQFTPVGSTFTLTSGILPTGMTLSSSGLLSGTPTRVQNFPLTITATPATGCAGSVSVTLVISCATITISPATSPLPTGSVGTAYPTTRFTQTGGVGSITYSGAGSFPRGMIFSSAGFLLGTPTQGGSFAMTIKATDSNGCTGTLNITLVIACPTVTVGPGSVPSGTAGVPYSGVTFTQTGGTGSFPITVTATDQNSCTGSQTDTLVISCSTINVGPTTIPSGATGVPYSETFTQTGGVGTVTLGETGTLPTGITFVGGSLSGTPTQTGSFPITIIATDSAGCTGNVSVTLVVNCQTITISPTSALLATVNAPYPSTTFTETGGVGTVTFTESGTLPAGMTFSGRVLSGTPTQTGIFSITVTATDSIGCTDSETLGLAVACPGTAITIAPGTVASGIVNTSYSPVTFTASGGSGSYTMVEAGTLPTGMTFSSGTLSGTPTQTGVFPFAVMAQDANGCGGVTDYVLAIACAGTTITVSPASLTAGAAGTAYPSTTFSASGGSGSYSLVFGGALPAGMTYSNGVLSGTPTQGGTFQFTVGAQDANGCGGSTSYTLNIACPTITVTPSSLSPGLIDTVYPSATFTQTGGVGTVTFSNTGALPAGMTLSSGGVLSGTPAVSGTFPLTVVATDSDGCTGSVSVTLVINCNAITVSPPTIPSGTVGIGYSAIFIQSGGVGTTTFTESGTLPAGTAFAPTESIGVVLGTPTQPGTFPITITATDSEGCSGSQTYSLVINCQAISVSPSGTLTTPLNAPYNQQFFNSTGAAPVTFSETGMFPPGLTLSTGGLLSGTPTQMGRYPITVTATDANGCTGTASCTIVIACPIITVSPNGLGQSVFAGHSMSPVTFTETGGVGAVTLTESGALPAGVTFVGGLLSGTPVQLGNFQITVTATDSLACVGTGSYSITVTCGLISVQPQNPPRAVAGVVYPTTTFTQTGGVGSVTFTETGTLPPGMTFVNGVLSGTPTQVGAFPFTVTATDSLGCFGEAAPSIAVDCPTITVSPAFVPVETEGVPITPTTFTATGGVGDITFSFVGALPPGVTLGPDGTLSGTPTMTGPFEGQIIATDSNGCTGLVNVGLPVGCPGVAVPPVSPAIVPSGVVNTPYPTVTFTTGLEFFRIVPVGSLPDGMNFNATTGVNVTLFGTPTQSGLFPFSIMLQDGNGCTTETNYILAISCGSSSITVAPGTLLPGVIGAAYSNVTFSASGGAGPYTLSFAGALPAGMNWFSGVLSGTPTQTGIYQFTVGALDAAGCAGSTNYTLTINCQTITVSPGSLPVGVAGSSYPATTFTQTGGTGTVTFSETGILPAGMIFDPTSAQLSGTPTQTGSFPITVKATDSAGCVGSQSLTLAINCPTITVNPATLSTGITGVSYMPVSFTQTGGIGSITFTETGTLPNGMTFSAAGMLSGTPTQTGNFPITVRATDSNGCFGTVSVTLTINCPTITVSPSFVPDGRAGTALAPVSFTQTGGIGTVTFTEAGALPNGLTLSSDGTLSGTPTQTGNFPIIVKATDSDGCFGTQSVTITILCPVIFVDPMSLAAGVAGVTYAPIAFSQRGGVGTITFAESGALPSGMTFTAGTLSGTPAQTGSFPILITTTDANGCSGSNEYTLSIACPSITVAPLTVAVGTAGVAYTPVTFSQTGGVGAITFSESGSLPAGMTFSGGTLSGTPTQTGTFNISVTATDSNGCTGSQNLTLSIDCQGLAVGPDSIPLAVSGSEYQSTTFTQTGAIGGAKFTLSGALSSGMTFTNGVLSGTPTQTGAFPITVTVTDGNGCTGSGDYVIAVSCPGVAITVAPGVLTAATSGLPYPSTTFSASGGTAAYTFTEAGALPTGMTFAGGVLSGTPTESGVFPITVAAVDSTGCAGATNYLLAVACEGTTITVSPGTVAAAVTGVAYSPVKFSASGGSGILTLKFAGVLPEGMTYSNGTLSGTPTVAGAYQFTVAALDANGCAGATNYTLADACPSITVTPGNIPQGTAGVSYTGATVAQSGGVGKVTFGESGTLPAGMTFSGNQLSGTPLKTGSFPITITATDSDGCTGHTNYTLVINCPTITVTPSSLPLGTSGVPYTVTTLGQTGGVGSITYSETGTMPGGLTMTSTGVISGTPTQNGTFPITVTATDSNGCTGSRTLTIQLGCSTITLSPSTLPQSVQAEPYQVQFTQTGGKGTVSFSTKSALPTGVTLSASGLLSGTPTQGGTFSITVIATDSNGCTGAVTVTLNVTALGKCLKDDHNGDFVQFNTTTGDYVFTHCGTSGFILSGKGAVTTKSGTIMLTDVESDRSVTIAYLSNQFTGTAVIVMKRGTGLSQTYSISDTNIHPVCVCGS